MLKRAGFICISALGVSNALRLCDDGNFDLLLLSHTVPAERRGDVMRAFRRTCNGPVLAMHTPFEQPLPDADYNFDSSNTPAEFIALVIGILSPHSIEKAAKAS
jgi:hypothetical protein